MEALTVSLCLPPIAKDPSLFKNIHDAPLMILFSDETKFPNRDLNGSDSFCFFKDEPYLVKQNESQGYHGQGLAKYNEVANLTPRWMLAHPSRYRIIETFDPEPDVTFRPP